MKLRIHKPHSSSARALSFRGEEKSSWLGQHDILRITRRSRCCRGYNNNDSAQDGEIRDMTNMSGDLHPILAPRKPRYLVRTITKPNGFLAHDGYYWVDGTGLYSSSSASKRGTLTDGRKTMAVLGLHIVILPDKKYLRTGAKGTYASTAALSAAVTSPSAGDVYAWAPRSPTNCTPGTALRGRILDRSLAA